MSLSIRCAIGWLVLLATWHPALAGVKLLLEDGQVLEGRSVEREGPMYLLTLETDNVLPIPVPLVASIERTEDESSLPRGLTKAEPVTLAGDPAAARLPTLADLMHELRASASVFQPGVIDSSWVPVSDWDLDPQHGNNFHPVHWYRPPIDPRWEPTSGLREGATWLSPVRWYRAPIDPTWRPTDGFAARDR